jgi:Protein of unknown function (Gmx_para_CXXCG)
MTPQFWLLRWACDEREAVVRWEDYERVVCPIHRGHTRGGKRIGALSVRAPPFELEDFVWTNNLELLVSQRLLDVFDQNRVTGFEAKSVKVSYDEKSQEQPPELFELVVVGWGGVAAAAARPRLTHWCPHCQHKHYTIAEPSRLIDPAQWDGSDLFMVWPLPGYRFVSNRLADILRRERVSGVKLIPASEIPMERGGGASPGNLRYRMPEDRARELDQRFGLSNWLVEPRSVGLLTWLFGTRQGR